ncbi:MAG: SH3 domain-containing protein [Amphritea sp.]|nr:SH3 domain-containing protein [Amphritea sp.]
MMSARKPVITLLCLLSCLLSLISSSAFAATERLEVRIRSTILNIRETTSTKSPIIDVLQQGDVITVTTTGLPDWIRLDDGRGYISIHYVDVLSRTPVIESPAEIAERTARQPEPAPITEEPAKAPTPEPSVATTPVEASEPEALNAQAQTPESQAAELITEETATTEVSPPQETPLQAEPESTTELSAPLQQSLTDNQAQQPDVVTPDTPAVCSVSSANSEMTVSSIATTCRKNLKTLYYEACEVAFNLEFNSSCDQAGEVSVTCSATVQTTNINQTDKVAELQQEATIYLKEKASSRQKLLWMPATAQQQITDIQLRQKLCVLN